MAGFHHILFPVDFSEPCRAVYPFVKDMAARFDARVTVLHAVHVYPATFGAFGNPYAMPISDATLQEAAQKQLDDFVGTLVGGMATVCQPGEPAGMIEEYSQANDVDLVMMPTHGYGPFRRLLLGSLTAKVLHDLECPVWTAAHTTDHQPLDRVQNSGYKSIVCAIDVNAEGVCVLKRAVDMAGLLHADLCVVHAAPDILAASFYGNYRRVLLEGHRAEIAKMQRAAGTDLEAVVESRDVSKLVRDVATQRGAGLVTIGRGRLHDGLGGRLRTHTYSIIRDSPCPVLSL